MAAAGAPSWVAPGVPASVWRLIDAGSRAGDDDKRRRCLLDHAEADARAALAGHEEDTGRRFALVIVLGMRANTDGGRAKVRAAAELHAELNALLAQAPEHAQARHMLGRLHAGVRRMNGVTRWLATNLLGGGVLKEATWEEAERNLAFAERTAPEVMDHHLQLANLYRDTGRPQLALQEVEHVLRLTAGTSLEEGVRAEALRLRESLERSRALQGSEGLLPGTDPPEPLLEHDEDAEERRQGHVPFESLADDGDHRRGRHAQHAADEVADLGLSGRLEPLLEVALPGDLERREGARLGEMISSHACGAVGLRAVARLVAGPAARPDPRTPAEARTLRASSCCSGATKREAPDTLPM